MFGVPNVGRAERANNARRAHGGGPRERLNPQRTCEGVSAQDTARIPLRDTASTMVATSPWRSTLVEAWFPMLVHWLALGGVRMQTWALAGVQRHIEGMWRFVASLRIPFGDEDFHDISMERLGLQRREVALGEERWRLRHVDAWTQLEAGPRLGPTDAPSWNSLWRFEAYSEPWALRRGPPTPDDNSPYPGMGTFQLRRRLRMHLLTMRARVSEWELVRYHFDTREIEVLVHILAPFPQERAWLREGNGQSPDPAAAPRRLLGPSPLQCRGRSRGARLLSRAVVGPVLRSLGRGAACSADGPRRGRAAGAREWTPTNAITRWRMRPVHMAIALTRQVIQRQCQCTIPIVRIGALRD